MAKVAGLPGGLCPLLLIAFGVITTLGILAGGVNVKPILQDPTFVFGAVSILVGVLWALLSIISRWWLMRSTASS